MYTEFYNQYDEAVRNGADAATRAGLEYLQGIFPQVAVLFVLAMGVALATNNLSFNKFTSYAVRLGVTMWLVLAGAYIPHVRDLIVDDIPNAAARAVGGGMVDERMGAVRQFEMIDAAAGNYVAEVNQVATGLFQIGNKIAAWFARGMQKIFLTIVFFIWIAMRQLSYLTCAVGAFMILFLPFETTRSWTMQHLSKMLGIAIWQISASILLKIMLGGVQIYLKRISTTGLTLSIDQQVDQCLDIAMFFLGMTALFIMIPATVGIGAAAAASSSVASGMMAAGGANMIRAGNSLQKAGANLNKAAKEMMGRMRDNRANARQRP